MGVSLQVFRLVQFDGPDGCAHHLLARAGRPSYPNYDQSAEDAAESLVDSTLATMRTTSSARARGCACCS